MIENLEKSELIHYERHLCLDEIGLEGQLKLKKASILCVGAGGLGSSSLMYLASAGVGHITVMDFDVVNVSNLQRQIIYDYSDVGKSKAEIAASKLRNMNPHIVITVIKDRLTEINALEIISKHDLVVDGADNFEARYLIADSCEILGKTHVFAAISEFESQISVFNYKNGPSYRDIYPEPPVSGTVKNCAEAGVLGVLPGIAGCIQANEALKVILGLGNPLSGRLLYFNALDMKFREMKFTKMKSRISIKELKKIQYSCTFEQLDNDEIKNLNLEQVDKKIQDGWKPFIVDVRKPYESELSGNLNWVDLNHPHDKISEKLDLLPKEQDILVYCASGVRSKTTCDYLIKKGYERVYNLERGLK